jgi:glutamine amidotransferase
LIELSLNFRITKDLVADMIAVINYDRGKSIALGGILEKLDCEYSLTKNEREICRADKIILPDSTNIDSTVKKLQLLNLASVLRVINRPILGINMGFAVLFKNIIGHGIEGLGLLNNDVHFFQEHDEFIKEEHTETIEFIFDSILLSEVKNFSQFNFSGNLFIPIAENTKSKTTITGIDVSATVETKRVYGIQFNPERSGIEGEKVLSNFVKSA